MERPLAVKIFSLRRMIENISLADGVTIRNTSGINCKSFILGLKYMNFNDKLWLFFYVKKM